MSELAAIVLAAGVSSRMGKFKPLLDINEKTMIRRVVDNMTASGAEPVVIVTGYRAEDVEEHLRDTGVVFVRNERYFETQMLDSLLLGTKVLPTETKRVLISPADIPMVENDTIQAILAAEGPFVRPNYHGRHGHPIVLSHALLSSLVEYCGPDGLRGAMRAYGVKATDVAVEDRGTVLDGDTREEYAKLLRYCREVTGEPVRLQLDMQIYLQGETSFWGAGCVQLLELIRTTGSILSACLCMHMSYSKGWKIINEIERQMGYPVLVRHQDGSYGDDSRLTAEGVRFLETYRKMCDEIQKQGQQIFQRYFPIDRTPPDRL